MAEKEMIKYQLPPNLATLSDIRWPVVNVSSGSFKRLSTTSFSSIIDFSTISVSLASCSVPDLVRFYVSVCMINVFCYDEDTEQNIYPAGFSHRAQRCRIAFVDSVSPVRMGQVCL